MKNYSQLTIHEKIQLKQHAINLFGKHWHASKPNFLSKLNKLQIHTILN